MVQRHEFADCDAAPSWLGYRSVNLRIVLLRPTTRRDADERKQLALLVARAAR